MNAEYAKKILGPLPVLQNVQRLLLRRIRFLRPSSLLDFSLSRIAQPEDFAHAYDLLYNCLLLRHATNRCDIYLGLFVSRACLANVGCTRNSLIKLIDVASNVPTVDTQEREQ